MHSWRSSSPSIYTADQATWWRVLWAFHKQASRQEGRNRPFVNWSKTQVVSPSKTGAFLLMAETAEAIVSPMVEISPCPCMSFCLCACLCLSDRLVWELLLLWQVTLAKQCCGVLLRRLLLLICFLLCWWEEWWWYIGERSSCKLVHWLDVWPHTVDSGGGCGDRPGEAYWEQEDLLLGEWNLLQSCHAWVILRAHLADREQLVFYISGLPIHFRLVLQELCFCSTIEFPAVFRASSFIFNPMASLDFPFSMFGTNSYITGNCSISFTYLFLWIIVLFQVFTKSLARCYFIVQIPVFKQVNLLVVLIFALKIVMKN